MKSSPRFLQDQACDNVFKGLAERCQTSNAAFKALVCPLWHRIGIILQGLQRVVQTLLYDVADILSYEHALHEDTSVICVAIVTIGWSERQRTSSGGTS